MKKHILLLSLASLLNGSGVIAMETRWNIGAGFFQNHWMDADDSFEGQTHRTIPQILWKDPSSINDLIAHEDTVRANQKHLIQSLIEQEKTAEGMLATIRLLYTAPENFKKMSSPVKKAIIDCFDNDLPQHRNILRKIPMPKPHQTKVESTCIKLVAQKLLHVCCTTLNPVFIRSIPEPIKSKVLQEIELLMQAYLRK